MHLFDSLVITFGSWDQNSYDIEVEVLVIDLN